MSGAVLLCAVAALAVAALWQAVAAGRRAGALRERCAAVAGAVGGPVRSSARGAVASRWAGCRAAVPHGAGWALAAGAGTAFLAGGAGGAVAGGAVAAAVLVWRRRAERSRGREEDAVVAERVRRQLPLAADLLAACFAAGAGPREAADAVGGSLGGPLGERLVRTAAELRLGGDPAQCWARLGETPGAAALGRRMERACGSGAPPARPMEALAAQCRADAVREAQARARRAGVLATAPLGLCFLPAFLLVGVVPLVIGLTDTMLAGS